MTCWCLNLYRSLLCAFLSKDTIQILMDSAIFFFASCLSIILMLYLIRNEQKLQQHPILISSIISTLITLNHLIPLIGSSREVGTVENGSYVLFNIIVIYSILPVSKHITILLASLVSFLNLAILGFLLTNSGLDSYIILKRVSRPNPFGNLKLLSIIPVYYSCIFIICS